MSKSPATDRSHGGPGSSAQNADGEKPHAPPRASGGHRNAPPDANVSTNSDRSQRSGGGGERDKHHTHDPRTKS